MTTPDIQLLMEAADLSIKQFEKDIWYGRGVAAQLNEAQERGFKGQAGDLTVMVFTIAGRVMITFTDELGDTLTLMTEDGSMEPRMGLHTRTIALGDIHDWLERAAAGWTTLEPASDVTLDVIAALRS